MSTTANPPILTGSSSWRGGGFRTSRAIDSPAIKEVLYPSHKGATDFFLPRTTTSQSTRGNNVPPVVPRRVYTRSFTTPASVVQILPSRPQRRVTFDLPPYTSSSRSGATMCLDFELDVSHNISNSNTAGIPTSVCEVAGVASWLRSRRHLNNKESFKIKNLNNNNIQQNNNNNNNSNLNRRYSSVLYSGNGTSCSSGFTQVRRVSAAAAIDASKLPPTVGPVAGSSGPAAPCTSSTPCTAAGLALLRACHEGDEEVLQDLMSGKVAHVNLQPADVNCADSSGRTPVSFVASSGSLSMLESLARFPSVDFNHPDNEGNTPLHFAAQAGHVEVLNLLLSRCAGVEVDSRNVLGFTPLMKAALQGRTKCAKLLLFAGASPSLRDLGRGFRAEQWARYCGRHVCAEVIDKFSRHRLLERAAAAHVNSGRWGSEPELSSQPSTQQAPQQQQQHSNSGGGSWLRSKLRRAFRSNADSSSSKSKHQHGSDFSVTSQIGPVACATSTVLPSPSSTPPPQTPRVFIVPKVQVTPAVDSPTNPNVTIIESSESSQARPVVTSNARRKK